MRRKLPSGEKIHGIHTKNVLIIYHFHDIIILSIDNNYLQRKRGNHAYRRRYDYGNP